MFKTSIPKTKETLKSQAADAQKLCALRELVLAQKAYKRAVDEFDKALGRNVRELPEHLQDYLVEFCEFGDPRDLNIQDMRDLEFMLSNKGN